MTVLSAPERQYQPPPLPARPSLGDRFVGLAREAVATRRRAWFALACAVAGMVLVLAAMPRTLETADDRGAVVVRCGIDTVLLGHANAAVETACRDEMAVRAVVSAFAGAVLLGGAVSLAGLAIARSRAEGGGVAGFWAAVTGRPADLALVLLTLVAAGIAIATLWTVPIDTVVDGDRLVGRCGIDTAVLGHDDARVERACRDAVGVRRPLLLVAAPAAIVGTAVLYHRHGRRVTRGGAILRRPAGIALVVCAAVAAVIALGSARPRTVDVTVGDSTVVVACGIDVVITGHPTAAVDRACGNALDGQAPALLGSLAALAGAGAGLVHLARARPRREVPT